MGFTVKVTGGDKYQKVLEQIISYRKGVKAGVPWDATNAETGMSVALYGIYNELGTPNAKYPIPPRPFMRRTAADKQDKWCHIIAGHLKYVQIKNDADQFLWLCGEAMKGDIKESIQHGSWTPDAPATVKAKEYKGKVEANHPLIDTGDLLKSIIYEVYKP